MKKLLLPGIFCIFLNILCRAQQAFPYGQIHEIESAVLGEKRILNVYIPEGYDKDSAASMPVIYLLDGSASEDFIHISGLVQFFRLRGVMPPALVVGIANTDRKRDFTFPTSVAEDKARFPATGGSAAFIHFLEKEVTPFVEEKYGKSKKRILIGQSLGGLLATEILLKKRSLFDTYLIVSPSLWWDRQSLLKQAGSFVRSLPPVPAEVFVSAGNEGPVMKRDARRLYRILLQSRKYNIKAHFSYLPGEDHSSILHEAIYRNLFRMYPAAGKQARQ